MINKAEIKHKLKLASYKTLAKLTVILLNKEYKNNIELTIVHLDKYMTMHLNINNKEYRTQSLNILHNNTLFVKSKKELKAEITRMYHKLVSDYYGI